MSEPDIHYHAFFATCPRGLEELLADELRALGGKPQKSTVAGVHFRADLAVAYRACLWSRLANRIVLCLARETDIEQPAALREAVARVAWTEHLCPGATLAVDFHGRSAYQMRFSRTVRGQTIDQWTVMVARDNMALLLLIECNRVRCKQAEQDLERTVLSLQLQ